MRRERMPLVLLVVALLLAAPPAAADWKDQLREVEQHLGKDRSAQALRIARRVTDEMVEKLAPGEAASRAFGSVLALRAMAEAAEGLEDDARFHWGLAVHFRPDLVRSHLAAYGEGGRIVGAWQASARDDAAEAGGRRGNGEKQAAAGESTPAGGARVEPPRRLSPFAQPQYTDGARADGVQGIVILQAVVDETGKVGGVKILRSLHPGLDYRAAEAVRAWRYEPARFGGEPVDIYYNLTITFSLE